jgi:hypothetical protein
MYHYIHVRISPPKSEILAVRKTISAALSKTYGLSAEGTYVDVLSLAANGEECILRVQKEWVLGSHGQAYSLVCFY